MTMCPALRTIIIQHIETEATTNGPLRQSLSLETVAYYRPFLIEQGLS